MSQVAVRLYRQLHRVRRNYQQAQIPLVGIVGFNEPPTTDIRSHLASAFRAGTDVARQGSVGFRALRQAQQQLQVLKGCEEETREALRCWYQLCQAWSARAQIPQRPFAVRLTEPGADSTDPRVQPANGPPGTDTTEEGAHAVSRGCSNHSAAGVGGGAKGAEDAQRAPSYAGVGGGPADVLAGVVRAGGGGGDTSGQGALARRFQGLSAALEDGALLVERLYDANHLSLEDFDEQGAEAAAMEDAAGAGGGGPAAAELLRELGFREAAAEASGTLAAVHLLPAALCTATVAAARRQLDELAAAVAAAYPGLFSGGGGRGPGGGGGSCGASAAGAEGRSPSSCAGGIPSAGQQRGAVLRQQLEAISQVLFHEYKFRHEPVEWVYDGLAPALLPQVLVRRRGIPLSLAVLYCGVARRLGVSAVPVKASADSRPSVDEGPAALHGLPPDVAARQAGRTVAVAPPLDAWLVAAAAAAPDDPADASAASAATDGRGPTHGSVAGGVGAAPAAGQVQEQEQGLFVDVDRRGRVLTIDEARRRYSDLPVGELAALLPYSPLELWIELVRVMLTAHTRRGESDLVAHWLVQALALDHRSPEWRVMGVQ